MFIFNDIEIKIEIEIEIVGLSYLGRGALPYVGRYHLPVNKPPYLTQSPHPMTP